MHELVHRSDALLIERKCWWLPIEIPSLYTKRASRQRH